MFGDGVLKAEVVEIVEEGTAVRSVRRRYLKRILDRVGIVPLPPYIQKNWDCREVSDRISKYKGSAAAPTAGLILLRSCWMK